MDDILQNYINDLPLLKNLIFVNRYLKDRIIISIDNFFPLLYNHDKNILTKLVIYFIEKISLKNNFEINSDYYMSVWTQNNNESINSIVLLILPFIDIEKGHNKEIKQLSEIYLSHNIDTENEFNSMLCMDRIKCKEKYLNYSNILTSIEDNNITYPIKNNIYEIIYSKCIALNNTLNMINGKYYVNWINIIPENNYRYSHLYLNVINHIQQAIDSNYLTTAISEDSNNGLWVGDFYNVIRNYLYQEILPIKWTIYVYKNNYIIQYFNSIFPIDKYDILDIENNLLILSDKLQNCHIGIYLMCNYLLTFFMSKKYNSIDELDDYDEENNALNIKLRSRDNLKELLSTIRNKYLEDFRDYIKYVYDSFKKTFYGKYLFEHGTLNISNELLKIGYYSNLKNIYSVSKMISHKIENRNLIRLNKNYSLLGNDKSRVLNNIFFLNNINNRSRLNIVRNIVRQNYFEENNVIDYDLELNFNRVRNNLGNINRLMNNIHNDYIYNIYDIVFMTLYYKGILSKFVPCPELTNMELISTNEIDKNIYIYENLKNRFDTNRNVWDNCYYYLNDYKYNEIGFFDTLTDKKQNHKWMLFYSLNFISQMDFFCHFIHNSIILTTGATGQGKSTQVPKLILYALKSIDYKYTGNVICTAPRTDPLLNNAKRISQELGVSIEENPNNFYVQYKYMKGNHENYDQKYNIKIVTDGVLKNTIFSNISMYSFVKKINKYLNDPINDVIFIDEVHEHNANMDFILSLLKVTLQLNNKLRLYIVSATLEDDEPIYRAFYKNIKDENTYFNYNDHRLLNRYIYLDRRYNISSPNIGRKYTIIEHYDDDINLEISNNNYNDVFEYAQSKGDKLVTKLSMNNTKNRHILYFLSGKFDINKSIEYLNNNIRDDHIALPYFSKMDEQYKVLIGNIAENIKYIKNRENVHIDWSLPYNKNLISDKPVNRYKYVILISTTIAEASITIRGLYYVVDTGFAKTEMYNGSKTLSDLRLLPIAEYNRIQRKGRVGRVASGEVYYLYRRNSRKDVVPLYNITSTNVYPTMIEFISYNNTPNNLIMTRSNNNDVYMNKTGLNEIYEDNNIERFNTNIYSDGFTLDNVIDSNYDFYVIHPFEDRIVRNIFNKVIKYKEKDSIDDFFNYSINSKFLIKNNNSYIKSEIYNICNNFIISDSDLLNWDIRTVLIMLHAISFDIVLGTGNKYLLRTYKIIILSNVLNSFSITSLLKKRLQIFNIYDSELMILDYLVKEIDNLSDNKYYLNKFIINLSLNENIVEKYLINTNKYMKSVLELKHNFKDNKYFNTFLFTSKEDEIIIKCFLSYNPIQFFISKNNKYYTSNIIKYYPIELDKKISIKNIGNVNFYYKYNINDNTIIPSIVSYVDIKWVNMADNINITKKICDRISLLN